MLPYGPSWRKWRRSQHSSLHARAALSYKPIQSLESKLAMHQILETPAYYEQHLQRYAASVATSVAYGRRVTSVDEWIVKENMESMDCMLLLFWICIAQHNSNVSSTRFDKVRISIFVVQVPLLTVTRLSMIIQCEVCDCPSFFESECYQLIGLP